MFLSISEAYSDANWVSDNNKVSSTNGFIFTWEEQQLHGSLQSRHALLAPP